MSGTIVEEREQERKLEGLSSDGPGTNCTFDGNDEIIVNHMFRPDFQRTCAICGLRLRTSKSIK